MLRKTGSEDLAHIMCLCRWTPVVDNDNGIIEISDLIKYGMRCFTGKPGLTVSWNDDSNPGIGNGALQVLASPPMRLDRSTIFKASNSLVAEHRGTARGDRLRCRDLRQCWLLSSIRCFDADPHAKQPLVAMATRSGSRICREYFSERPPCDLGGEICRSPLRSTPTLYHQPRG